MFLYVGKSAWEFFVHDRYIYRMGIKRMVGIDVTYGDPNSFAASICYSLPLTWALIRSHFEHPGVKLFLWSYGLLALVAIVFTGSRSGMVTFVFFLRTPKSCDMRYACCTKSSSCRITFCSPPNNLYIIALSSAILSRISTVIKKIKYQFLILNILN